MLCICCFLQFHFFTIKVSVDFAKVFSFIFPFLSDIKVALQLMHGFGLISLVNFNMQNSNIFILENVYCNVF